MATIVVSYPSGEGATFDRAYYVETHLPLAQEAWGDKGLTGAEVYFASDHTQPFAAVAALKFESQAAIDLALASPGTARVMGDIPNFTNVQPVLFRAD